MDFFEYANISSYLLQGYGSIWLPFVIGGICFLIVYVFQSVGLYTLAKNNGYNRRWMAFVPFINTYYIGVLGDKNKFFNFNTRIVAMVAAILEFLLVIAYIVHYIGLIWALEGGYVAYTMDVDGLTETLTQIAAAPADMAWTVICALYVGQVASYVSIVYELLLVITLSCFFQTYAASRYLIFTLTSIFLPVQGILIFIIMNNKGMSYREYMRKVQQRNYQIYQQQQGQPYNNPYSNPYQGARPPESGTYNDPYSGENPTPQPKAEVEDPFDGLGATPKQPQPKDPFDPDDKN